MEEKSQEELEIEMTRLGVERYQHKRRKAESKELETTIPGGQWLLRNTVSLLQSELEDWMELAENRPGRAHRAVEYYKLLPTDLSAALIARTVLDSISTAKKFTRSAMVVAGVLEDEVRFRALAETDPGLWRDLYERTKAYMGYGTKRRHIMRAMKNVNHSFSPWSQRDKVQIGVVGIDLLAKATGLVEIRNRTTIFGKTRTELAATPMTLKWLEKSHDRCEILTPIFLPCIEPPKDWTGVVNGGFHTSGLYRRALIKTADLKYIESIKDHEMPEVYDAVNALQRVPFRINTQVLEVLRHFWSKNLEVEGIPRREDMEVPARPADIDENDEARKAWRRQAAAIHDRNARTRAERLTVTKVIHLAEKYGTEPMYFTAQLDWRSRCYPTSYHLHPQGPDFVKAMLLFENGKPVGKDGTDGYRWLMIHGANCWGLDKSTFDERVKWAEEFLAEAGRITEDPYHNREWEEADKPWQFLAWCFDVTGWWNDQSGYVSRLPIAQDATQSGIQIMSLLLRDPVGAEATNCTPSEKPQDLYLAVTQKTLDNLEAEAAEGSEVAQMWLDFGVDRKACKRPVMTRVYNSTLFSCLKYVREWVNAKQEKQGGLPLEDNYRASLYLAKTIWDSMDEVIDGTKKCMKWLGEVADICVKNEIPIRWTTPADFPVKQAYFKWSSKMIKTKIGDTIRQHSIREENEGLDRRRMCNGLAPNFVHSLDAAALFKTVTAARGVGVEDFAMVHDSFATLAADSQSLAESIRLAYARIFQDDVLAGFAKEVAAYLPADVELPELPEYGSLDIYQLLTSDYFFS
ncbi:hypothetical protein CMI37_01570 [Candidatus Pacearchaeota archaeon]|nr:hypothetical protein [Candidatus Pacearchaeota archaeon]